MYKVWLADDEPFVTDGLKRQVNWESYNMEIVGTAANGQDVLDGLAARPAHLLITDISMPQMDGLTLISKAKLINPLIRCVIVSAYNEFEYVKKALQLGVENYLLKPINDSELRDTLSKTMENLLRDQMAVSHDSPDVRAFRTNILDRWVNNTIQEYELLERAELLHIPLSAPGYAVCVLEVNPQDDEAAKFRHASSLLEICRGTFLPSHEGEFFLDGSFRVAIILYETSKKAGNRERLLALLTSVVEEAAGKGMKVFASAGPAATSSSDVSARYQSAVDHLNCRFLDPSSTIFVDPGYTDPRWESPAGSQMLVRYHNALKERNRPQALSLAENYLARFAECSYEQARTGILPLALSLVRTMIESGRISDALPSDTVTQLSQFAGIRSLDHFKRWLDELIDDSMQVIEARKGSYHLLIHLTLEQVNHHYATELSLKTLASGFNVSPAYLGQLFKEETGKYFNDYLTDVRLQTSRTLLEETDLKINEIVQRIGIPNQSYFNRVFKKTYGISPMEFRRQILRADGVNRRT